MIKHVVMWKLKPEAEGNSKVKNKEIATEKLLGLKPIISQITSLEVGDNLNPTDAAYDLVLISTHEDKASLAAYIDHPAHKEVAGFIGKIVADRKVVDFEV